jgi:hypothetical protein
VEGEEVVLRGGTLNHVVRVGDTVRRPAGPWTPAVHALLRHLGERGFPYSPRPFGTDSSGREMLSYIEGETVGWSLPWPDWIRSTELLQEVGAAVAQLHHAAGSFQAPPDSIWQSEDGGQVGRAIICHNDIAPYNVVAADGHLAGIIDWDQAAPGDPLSDLAFVAWHWVPLHGPFVASLMGWSDPDRAGRLRLLLDAYGLESRRGFIDAVLARILHNRTMMLAKAAAGDPAYQALVDQGHIAGMDEALSFVSAERSTLERALW